MRTPLIATAAALMALTTAPAFAAPKTEAPAPIPAQTPAPKATTKYCVDVVGTGSRLARRVCKTRAEWIAQQDFDPLARQVTR